MKIDLRKDKGILASSPFAAESGDNNSPAAEMTEDERIAEVMRRRLHAHEDEDRQEMDVPETAQKKQKKAKSSKRKPLREFLLFIILIAVSLYYLHDKGLLMPYTDIVMSFWNKILGREEVVEVLPEPMLEETLSEDAFNALMPVSDDLAALKDSLEDTPLAELIEPLDSMGMASDTLEEYTPVMEEPLELSDQDLIIINNRSLLLMLIEVVGTIPEGSSVFLKRDGLEIKAGQGGEWISQTEDILDKFVFGSFEDNFSTGNAVVKSKFEIIMNAERGFVAQELDAIRLLDVLAHPFNDYLEQIVIDLSRGVEDNPAKFSFSGTVQEIQFVLSSWAESRVNVIFRSADLQYDSSEVFITLDVEFFPYQP